jgi:hypothetical protein
MLGGTPEHIYRGVDQNDPRVLVERDLDMVTGACLLVRREIFAELGGFDSEYINGVEDVDFCLRQRARWRVVYCPDAVLEHHEGSSEGRFDHVSENLNRFRQKWRGRFGEDGTLTVREEATIRSPLDDGSIGSGASPAQQGASTSEAGEASRGEAMAREYRRSSAMPTPRRSDVVQLSGGTPDVAELANIAKASETANPRLEGIRQKVESGYYNTQEALDQVAGAVIDSGRVTDVAAEVVQTQSAIEQLANVPDVREDRVNEVTERLSTQGSAFYDTPEVRSATADGFLDEIA